MTSVEQDLQTLIDNFVGLFTSMIKDIFTFFSDVGGQMIMVIFLLMILILVIGIILTIYYI